MTCDILSCFIVTAQGEAKAVITLAGTVGTEYHRGTARKAREGMEEFNDPVLMLCFIQISECIHLPSETLKCLRTPKSIALDCIGIILYFK